MCRLGHAPQTAHGRLNDRSYVCVFPSTNIRAAEGDGVPLESSCRCASVLPPFLPPTQIHAGGRECPFAPRLTRFQIQSARAETFMDGQDETENRGVPSSILGPGTTPRIQKGRDWFARPFAFSEATEVLTANRLVHAKRSRRSSAAVVRCARRRSASPKSSAKVARSQ